MTTGMTKAERWYEVARRVANGNNFTDAERAVFGACDNAAWHEYRTALYDDCGGLFVSIHEYTDAAVMLALFLALEAEDGHEGEAYCEKIGLRTHDPHLCLGRHCTIHNPSDHHMRHFPQLWRDDRGMMERVCEHGVGHPDPDDLTDDRTHGCDGCCRPEPVTMVAEEEPVPRSYSYTNASLVSPYPGAVIWVGGNKEGSIERRSSWNKKLADGMRKWADWMEERF